MSFDWVAAEDAVFNWIVSASGLDADKVFWSFQPNTRQKGTFVTIEWDGPLEVGRDYTQSFTDLGRSAGQEIQLVVRGDRELVLRVQCFSDSVTGNSTSNAILSQIKGAIRLPSINTTLNDAGLNPFGTFSISHVPEIVGINFESRSVMDVRFYMVDTTSEFTGYIDTTIVSGTIDTGTTTVSGIMATVSG